MEERNLNLGPDDHLMHCRGKRNVFSSCYVVILLIENV